MSDREVGRLLVAIARLVSPLRDEVKRNTKKTDDLAISMSEIRGELQGAKAFGKLPWTAALAALLALLFLLGGGDVARELLKIF